MATAGGSEEESGATAGTGFAVTPKTDCPHVEVTYLPFFRPSKCKNCSTAM